MTEIELSYPLINSVVTFVVILVAVRLSTSIRLSMSALATVLLCVTSLLWLPWIGWLLAAIAFCGLVMRFSEADIIDCLWILLTAKLVSVGTAVALGVITIA